MRHVYGSDLVSPRFGAVSINRAMLTCWQGERRVDSVDLLIGWVLLNLVIRAGRTRHRIHGRAGTSEAARHGRSAQPEHPRADPNLGVCAPLAVSERLSPQAPGFWRLAYGAIAADHDGILCQPPRGVAGAVQLELVTDGRG